MFRTLLTVGEWIVALVIAVAAAFSKASPAEWDQPYQAHIKFAVEYSVPILVIFAFVTFGLKVVREFVDRNTGNKKVIKKTLDALQQEFFQATAAQDRYKNRVTLFKARTKLFTRKRFLKMYARSGTSYQNVKVEFAIDDEDIEGNEGIAGRAYFQNSMISEYDLPEWPNPENPNDEACKEYCKRSYMTWETAKKVNVKSRSVAAVVVRKGGERWGVLVLDSRDPKGVSLTAAPKKAIMNLVAQVLTNHI
ncbi:MAG: hypothetical protein KF876_12135 [Nitrospira sp.]|nr:hypothetical protein [Nitrospira sp.]